MKVQTWILFFLGERKLHKIQGKKRISHRDTMAVRLLRLEHDRSEINGEKPCLEKTNQLCHVPRALTLVKTIYSHCAGFKLFFMVNKLYAAHHLQGAQKSGVEEVGSPLTIIGHSQTTKFLFSCIKHELFNAHTHTLDNWTSLQFSNARGFHCEEI